MRTLAIKTFIIAGLLSQRRYAQPVHSCCRKLCTVVAKLCVFLFTENCALLIASYRSIAVSDTIRACERYMFRIDEETGERILDPYSSEDLALHNQLWNVGQIRALITMGVSRILCTSKGVLTSFETRIISREEFGQVDTLQSQNFQMRFVEEIQGNPSQIVNPTHRCFLIGERTIEALAIPSPGSPRRKLHHFGFPGGSSRVYAGAYSKSIRMASGIAASSINITRHLLSSLELNSGANLLPGGKCRVLSKDYGIKFNAPSALCPFQIYSVSF
jgi:hypothetical protein